ncbi:MAG: hypothetical protein KBB94_01725 [Legionellaceae bacterium]|nr:hypothetical protein [Legionellaceae bacterium]MBP9774811.1 hypothetical protein [Legionellaceae bacterium]
MKCNQCDKAAMYSIGPNQVPVCLTCYKDWKQISIDTMNTAHRAMQWADQTMKEILGFPPGNSPVNNVDINMGNINHINNSTVGLINNGKIQTSSIEVAIDSLQKNNQKEMAAILTKLSDLLLTDSSISTGQKKSSLELIEFIAEEAIKPNDHRKTGLIFDAIVKLEAFFSLVTSGLTVWNQYHQYLVSFFS